MILYDFSGVNKTVVHRAQRLPTQVLRFLYGYIWRIRQTIHHHVIHTDKMCPRIVTTFVPLSCLFLPGLGSQDILPIGQPPSLSRS
jgi:hypothetical protein